MVGEKIPRQAGPGEVFGILNRYLIRDQAEMGSLDSVVAGHKELCFAEQRKNGAVVGGVVVARALNEP